MKNTKSQIITRCLEEIRSGKSTLEECLAKYPTLREELGSLLKIARQIKPESAEVSMEFTQRARQRLFQEMEKSPCRFLDIMGGLFARLNPIHSLRMLAVILPLLIVMVFSGVLYASRGSLPDESLYGVKTGMENFNLAVTRDPYKKANIQLVLIERRVGEIITLNQMGRPVTAETLEYLSNCLDQALSQIGAQGGVDDTDMLEKFAQISLAQKERLGDIIEMDDLDESEVLNQAYQVTRRGVDMAILAKRNPQVLQAGVSLTQSSLDTNRFTLRGKLLQIGNDNWNIGGVVLKNVRVKEAEMPASGAILEVKGLFLEKGTFITDISIIEMSGDRVILGGTFIDSDEEGRNWDISGLAINTPTGMSSPLPGQEFEIQGVVNVDSDTVDWEEDEDSADLAEKDSRSVEASGQYSPVDLQDKSNQETISAGQDASENRDENGSNVKSNDAPVNDEAQDDSGHPTGIATNDQSGHTVETSQKDNPSENRDTKVKTEGSQPKAESHVDSQDQEKGSTKLEQPESHAPKTEPSGKED